MRSPNASPRKKYAEIIIGCFIVVALSALIITSLKRNSKTNPGDNDNVFLHLIEQSSVLQEDFQTLRSLNAKYILITSDSTNNNKAYELDSLQTVITKKQLAYSTLIDSIQSNGSSYNQNSFDLFNRILQSYRSALNENIVLNKIINKQQPKGVSSIEDSSMLIAMRDRLVKNEIEKMDLSQQLSDAEKKAQFNSPQNFKKLLKDQDTTLYTMLVSEREKNENLINYNAKLERDLANLKSQAQEKPQPATQSKPNNLNSASMIAKAELDLTKVDCYLLRADPGQIISNSKQRKDLLESAFNILTTLSKSNDAAVQQQVKAKMAKLQKIAADNHD